MTLEHSGQTVSIAGAVLAGDRVSTTLSAGIVNSAQLLADGQAAPAMLAALLAAALWINLATLAGAPVSTTHSIVGGFAGAGLAVYGLSAVNWLGLAAIASGWIVSPLAAGLVSAGLLAVVRSRIDRDPDPRAAARRWLPAMVAVVTAVGAGMLVGGPLGQPPVVAVTLMALIGAAVRAAALQHLDRRLDQPGLGLDLRLVGAMLDRAGLAIGRGGDLNILGNVDHDGAGAA